jgi:ATP-dependent Clp protease ATP-binding subunit ClpC
MYDYFFWHYTEGTKRYLEIWKSYIKFFWRFFSVPLLLRTLFWPWRRDITRRGRGFDPQEFLQVAAFNFISRFMGALVKLITIVFCFVTELLVFVLGAGFFAVWLLLPVVILAFLLLAVKAIFASSFFSALICFLLAGLFFVLPGYFYSVSRQKFPSELSLAEMMKEDWFDLVWVRAGIDPARGRTTDVDGLSKLLKENDLTEEEFNHILGWVSRQHEERERKKMFWLEENLSAKRGIGQDWIYGFSVHLDEVSKELHFIRGQEYHLIGREKEVEAIERVLARSEENNVLVVGEPGVGKKTIIKKFAKSIYHGKALPALGYKRVLELDMGALMSGSANVSEMEGRLRMVLDEAVMAGNIILVIDNFHNFVGSQTGVGKIDIAGALMPYLASRHIQIIGITTYDGLHKKIETAPGLLKYFEKIEIKELEEDKMLLVLEDVVSSMEQRSGIRATYRALKEIVSKSGQYFADIAMPERAVDLLDEAFIYMAARTVDKVLEPRHVDLIISQKTEIPVGEVAMEEKAKLSRLEDILHQRVVNQEEAVKSIASAMRRARMGVAEKKRPIGSFLFLGSTGVGKTETARTLAEAYFGGAEAHFGKEEKMIRLDMSEYQNIYDVNRLIGASEEEPGYLTTAVRESPFSLVLFDEIEKAHPNILNLFLQVLDEGWLTDFSGRKVSFRNTIIIATSNAGAELIREMVGQGVNPAAEKEKLLDFLQSNNIFKPEFMNRFDGVIIFHPLSKEHLMKIAELMLKSLNKRLAEQKITLTITQPLLERVVELGYDPQYGARPMRRVIQDKIEDLISRKLLDGSLQKGQTLEIKPEEV